MKIALIQINPVIGDFSGNAEKIQYYANEAQSRGCALAVFPEMVLSGYPPQDLLERRSFVRDHQKVLEDLIVRLPDIDVMIGCFERRNESNGKSLFNSAIVIRDKQILYTARKQLLPSYDVFDETRYFEPGNSADLYRIDDLYFGVTVCEDVWYDEIGEYKTSPVDTLVAKAKELGVSLAGIINISASPFHRDKEETRKAIFHKLAEKFSLPFLYCNQVGGQDSLLFDGRSFVMASDGGIVAQALGFTEDMIIIDTKTWQGDVHQPITYTGCEGTYEALVMGVRDYTRRCGFTSAVLGLSGGIDSALTAVIAADALGADNVLGVAMPSEYSSSDSLEDAEQLAANIGCRFEIIPISELFAGFREHLAQLFAGRQEDLTEQNLQARIRGNLLMSLSNKFGSILLTTGNKSEMAVGYCTLYGDMSGGLAVISDVPKQMVYELSEYINRDTEIIPRRILEKAPTAELKPNQKDQDDLPPYAMLDQILELYLEQGESKDEIISRGYDSAVVTDILRRIRQNEYKRKQAPIGLKVTSKAFGIGRRYPITQRYLG